MARILRNPATQGQRAGPRRRLPSPAMAVAVLALCVAVGGVAVAAIPGPGCDQGLLRPGIRAAASAERRGRRRRLPKPQCGAAVQPARARRRHRPAGATGSAWPTWAGGRGRGVHHYAARPQGPGHPAREQEGEDDREAVVPAGSYVVLAKATVVTNDYDEIAGHLGGKPLSSPSEFARCKLTGGGDDAADVGTSGVVVAEGGGGRGRSGPDTPTTPEFAPRAGGTPVVAAQLQGRRRGGIDGHPCPPERQAHRHGDRQPRIPEPAEAEDQEAKVHVADPRPARKESAALTAD